MDTRYLRSLVAVVDTGSIAAAARLEGRTAPALSQRIQSLETQLGVALLTRGGHSVAPTAACRALLPRMRRMIAEAEALRREADPQALAGELTVGAIETALTGLLPAAIKALRVSAPGLHLRVRPGSSQALYEALLAGQLDAALIVAPPFEVPPALRLLPLRREALRLLLPPGLDCGAEEALRTQPWIRYDPESWGGRLAASWVASRGLAPAVFCDLDGLEAIARLVAEGLGVSLVHAWPGGPEGRAVPGAEPFARRLVLALPATPARARASALLHAALAADPAG